MKFFTWKRLGATVVAIIIGTLVAYESFAYLFHVCYGTCTAVETGLANIAFYVSIGPAILVIGPLHWPTFSGIWEPISLVILVVVLQLIYYYLVISLIQLIRVKMKKTINNQTGSAMVWVIVMIVILLGVGGFFYLKNSQPQVSTNPQASDINPFTGLPEVTGDSVNTGASDSSTYTGGTTDHPTATGATTRPAPAQPGASADASCSAIMPLNTLRGTYPDFKVSPGALADGVLTCGGKGGSTQSNLTIVAISIFPSPNFYDLTLQGISDQFTCRPAKAGIKSSLCLPKETNSYTRNIMVVLAASDGKHVATVSLIGPSQSDQSQFALQMSTELNPKLASLQF
jgi:hypothetical protein